MQEAGFKAWLERRRSAGTVDSRISNCRRVERYAGNLDSHYDADGLVGLMDRLNPRGPEHNIPINGNIYNGTATLRSAVGLYRDFRKGGSGPGGSTGAPAKPSTQERQTRRRGAHWPVWPQPNDEDLLTLARVMAPLVRFLDPGIVGAVVEDNRRLGAEWSPRLEALGIDPAIYLWEGSPCSFPGG